MRARARPKFFSLFQLHTLTTRHTHNHS
jgi:hypothetical protein